jgi:hypothetical protein
MMHRVLTRAGAVMIGTGTIALVVSNGQLARVSITAIASGLIVMALDANLARYGN